MHHYITFDEDPDDENDQPFLDSDVRVDIMEVRDDGVYANVVKIHINPSESKYISKQMVEKFQDEGYAQDGPHITILSLIQLA